MIHKLKEDYRPLLYQILSLPAEKSLFSSEVIVLTDFSLDGPHPDNTAKAIITVNKMVLFLFHGY